MAAAGGGFAVVPAEVGDTGTFVQQTAQNLLDGVRSADSEVRSLLSGWTGAAANAYGEGWEETRRGAVDVLKALDTMAELLGVAAASYTELDDANAAAIGSRQSSLDLP